MDSEAELQAIEANPARSSLRVSDKVGILQSSVVLHSHYLSKNIGSYQIVPYVTKISQNFWLIFILRVTKDKTDYFFSYSFLYTKF